ncbi:WhiB family transcriptional regulator [Janibacter alkaliphilus]|uniref:Transcriptional regulator WhiB n=1 Tax=Janibacter alkaliphilus TaxID=1069963 RepID=A0A852WXM5_9MICO|nr:WhiB family transcriptional regulator [Janibacter alkaliphilus]NYG35772.1 WhiB family redox-sensing transcriptional regulator [Janibacter alkaliphilus]
MGEPTQLPGPVADRWEWQYEGACRATGSELFYHPEGERGAKRRMRDASAKEICAGCPVLQQCRDHSIAIREPFGVWGGLTEDERARAIAAAERTATRLAG